MKENKFSHLIGQLRDRDPNLRQTAVESFWKTIQEAGLEYSAELGRHLRDALKDTNEGVRAAAALSLGGHYDIQAVRSLLVALKDCNECVVLNAAESLRGFAVIFGYMEGDDKKYLIKALKDKHANVRWGAARALGAFRRPERFKPLIAALKDESAYIRKEAAWGMAEPSKLGEHGFILELPHEALMPLIKALDDSESEIREWAANALTALPDVRAVTPLIKLLSDASESVRESAAETLTKIRQSKCVTENNIVLPVRKLIRELTKEDNLCRLWAAWALGKAESRLSIKPLIKALVDDCVEVRKMAASVLSIEDVPKNLRHFAANLRKEEASLHCELKSNWPEWDFSTFKKRHRKWDIELRKRFGEPTNFTSKKLMKKIKPKWYVAPDDSSRLPIPDEFDPAHNCMPGHKHCEFQFNGNLIHIDYIGTYQLATDREISVNELVIFMNGKFVGHGGSGHIDFGDNITVKPIAMLDKNTVLSLETDYLSEASAKFYKGVT